MNDRNLMILGGMIGAVVGVGVGFALFTERGRQLRAELQPEIEARDARSRAPDAGRGRLQDRAGRRRRRARPRPSAWPRRTVVAWPRAAGSPAGMCA